MLSDSRHTENPLEFFFLPWCLAFPASSPVITTRKTTAEHIAILMSDKLLYFFHVKEKIMQTGLLSNPCKFRLIWIHSRLVNWDFCVGNIRLFRSHITFQSIKVMWLYSCLHNFRLKKKINKYLHLFGGDHFILMGFFLSYSHLWIYWAWLCMWYTLKIMSKIIC